MPRNVTFDLRVGGGSTPEVLYGEVSLEPTAMHTEGTALVLPASTVVPLIDGQATIPNVVESPSGSNPAWAYRVKITKRASDSWTEYVAVPTGTGNIAYTALTRLIPPSGSLDLISAAALVEEATEAKEAAVAAAGLVGAPAGDTVLAAVSEGGAARGELESAFGENSEVFSDFTVLADGPAPATFDSGQPFRFTATPLVIRSGALVVVPTSTARFAGYLEPSPLSGNVTRIGCEFVIRRTAPEQTDGALAMGAWSTPGVVATYPGSYPVAGAHFVINRTGWTYNFYADTDPSDIGAGTFATPLAEGVPLTVEIYFSGDTAVIFLPDGTTATLKDTRIAQHVDAMPFWEPFLETGTARTNLGLLRIWAEGAPRKRGKRTATAADLAIQAFGRSPEHKVWAWQPAGDNSVYQTSTQTALHSEAAVTLNWPRTKSVLVEAEAWFDVPAGVSLYYAFTLNGSVTGAFARVATAVNGRHRFSTILTPSAAAGLKSGNRITVGWAVLSSGGSAILKVGSQNPATLSARPVDGVWNTSVPPAPTAPGALTLSATSPSSGQITLTWSQPTTVPPISGVELWTRRSSDGGITWGTTSMTDTRALSNSPYTMSGLATGVMHEWWVKAKNAVGTGPESNRVQITL